MKSERAPGALTQTTGALKLAIAAGAVLLISKFLTGLLTHSLAVMSSALDSAMDVAVSTVNLLAAREAAKPPDADHAYGHGKIESLAGLFQSTFIGLSGLYLVYEAVRRWVGSTEVRDVPMGIGVMIFSVVVSSLLVWRLEATSRKNQSTILATEKLHFTTDILTNAGVILALALVKVTGFVFWDLLVSMLVSVYIFSVSFHIFRRAVDELLDRSLPPVSMEEIETMILNHHPSIVGLHNFRSRQVGGQIFLDFHIEIRGQSQFKAAHTITEALIEEIQGKYPGSDVTVHYDPEGEK